MHTNRRQLGQEFSFTDLHRLLHQRMQLLMNLIKLLLRATTIGCQVANSCLDLLFKRRHPHHKKLI
jgi:hypothetical protein